MTRFGGAVATRGGTGAVSAARSRRRWTALAVVVVALALPRGATGQDVMSGTVLLEAGGAPVVGARVVAADSASGIVRSTTTRENGRFVLVLPTPRSVIAVGAAADGFGTAGPVKFGPDDRVENITLIFGDNGILLASSRERRAEGGLEVREAEVFTHPVVGTVRDAETGRPIPAASVVVRGGESDASVVTATDGDGRFALEPPTVEGELEVVVEALGYEGGEPQPFAMAGDPVYLSVTLRARPVDLPAIEVVVDATEPVLERWDVLDRASGGMGRVIFGEELEAAIRASGGRPSALFVRFPGTVVRQGEPFFLRNLRSGSAGGCIRPDLFVNGALARSGRDAMVDIPFDNAVGVDPENIIAVETFRNPITIPPAFRNLGSNCGAILIWTR